MITARKPISWEEFLRLDEESEDRLEFLNGEIYALATPSKAHNRVVVAISSQLQQQLQGTNCTPYSDNLAIRFDNQQVIPDGLIECGEQDLHQNFSEKPTVVFEILSPSNARKELGDKLTFYQSILSIQDYVVVDPLEVRIYHFHRVGENLVIKPVIAHLEGEVALESIKAILNVEELYAHLEG
jgi:Uma2 family endonuclease